MPDGKPVHEKILAICQQKGGTGKTTTAAGRLGTRLFNARIRETLAIREAQAQQQNIFDYAPRGNGATDYNALIEELTAND